MNVPFFHRVDPAFIDRVERAFRLASEAALRKWGFSPSIPERGGAGLKPGSQLAKRIGRSAKALLYPILLFVIGFADPSFAQVKGAPNKGARGNELPHQPLQQHVATQPGGAKLGRQEITGDVIGMHDLSPGGGSPIQGARPGSCTYCHVPHSGNGDIAPLWNQQLSKASYTTYTSTTVKNMGNQQMPLASDSGLCLSCHDGTVGVADTVLFGQIPTQGNWLQGDNFTTQLQSSHPFSLVKPLQDNVDLISTLVSQGKTGDPTGAVQLIQGNVECTSCHNPHVQAIDKISMTFLVRDSSAGQMCLACHDPTRTTLGGQNQVNPLTGWTLSAHAMAQNTVSGQANLGSYGTVGANACISCHLPHNATGAVRLLRQPNELDCAACHSGGNNLSPAAPNIFAEYNKIGHPFPNGTNQHDASEPAVLQNNRHATCVDCHNGHASQVVSSFNIPPLMRVSQAGVEGVQADGVTVVNPAVNQYENCLRCHGYSSGKGGGIGTSPYGYLPARASSDPLNVITQMNVSAKSSHPVMHVRSSGLPQPSLLPTMLDFSGGTAHGRTMGSQVFCTDCHNSDDNREFGLSGPNGPHGSRWWHILERDYEDSQAPAGPGTAITVNLNPQPNLSVNGPYGMCAKCHDLNVVMQPVSWTYHNNHVYTDGFSCSTCHTAHGMTSTSGNPTGLRMVDFDTNVVGQDTDPNGARWPISYDSGAKTCVLMCHNTAHDPGGGIRRLAGQQNNGTMRRR
jgi:predicted CXXCH cytochrome family protein